MARRKTLLPDKVSAFKSACRIAQIVREAELDAYRVVWPETTAGKVWVEERSHRSMLKHARAIVAALEPRKELRHDK